MTDTTVIIGAGHAGVQVAASLRQLGYAGRVILMTDEVQPPYHRPPLSKHMKDGRSDDPLPLRSVSFYAQQQVQLAQGLQASGINVAGKEVVASDGSGIGYDRLVIATGSRPRQLAIPGSKLAGVHVLRTHKDASAIAAELHHCEAPVAIGAGMIGLEFAAVASAAGKPVVVLEATQRVLGRAASATMAAFLLAEHRRRGVTLLTGEVVERLEGTGRVERLLTNHGRTIACDLVLLAVGAVPNSELAEAAGLAVANGIVVDATLRTSHPDIFAVGDCAAFPLRRGGPLVRLESVQNATDQAKHVARVIMGDVEPYHAVPWFWSDQYDLKLQIAGVTSVADRTEIVGDPMTGRFSVFCFADQAVIGVETVNLPREHLAARRLLASGQTLSAAEVAMPGFSLMAREKAASGANLPAGTQSVRETT